MNMAKKILVVDDERKIIEIVRAYLEKEGYRVLAATDGEAGLKTWRLEKPDLVVLDLMMPKMSGNDVCRIIRQESETPVIMLTARDELTDKIVGLELGADDYVTKPFEGRELVARIKAVLRRTGQRTVAPVLRVGDLTVDTERRQADIGGRHIELTTTEFDLLKLMAANPGRVFSRSEILDRLQGDTYEGYERTIDSHIKNLRRKLEQAAPGREPIRSIYGVGYKFEP